MSEQNNQASDSLSGDFTGQEANKPSSAAVEVSKESSLMDEAWDILTKNAPASMVSEVPKEHADRSFSFDQSPEMVEKTKAERQKPREPKQPEVFNEFAESEDIAEDSHQAEDVETSGEVTEAPETFTISANGEDISIPVDAEIEIMVDGEPTKVKLSEFRNDLSGQKAIARRFTALDQERKAVEQKMAKWNEGEAKVRDLLDNGKVVDALEVILSNTGESFGIKPEMMMVTLFEQMAPVFEQYMSLNADQKVLWAEHVKAEKHRMETETLTQKNARLQAEKDQLLAVRTVQHQYGLSDADFADLYHQLDQEMASGSLGRRPITPQLVGQYKTLLDREMSIGSALRSVDPSLADDKKAITDVMSLVNNEARRGAKVDDKLVEDVVSRMYGKQARVQKAKEVQRVVNKKTGSKDPLAITAPGKQAPQQGHFLDRLNRELDAAKSPTERRKIVDKFRNSV